MPCCFPCCLYIPLLLLLLLQKLEEGLQQGLYPPTREGFTLLCRHAKLIGQNCVRFNTKPPWHSIGKQFLKFTEQLVAYKGVQVDGLLPVVQPIQSRRR